MKPLFLTPNFLYFLCCAIFLITASTAGDARADTRKDAIAIQSKLHDAGAARKFPNDMGSLDAAMATAEVLNQANDTANAERYYRMVLQKALVIETQLQKPATPVTINDSKPARTPEEVPYFGDSPPQNGPAELPAENIASEELIGGSGTYTVASGESIRIVAAKLGVTRQHIVQLNRLDVKATLKAGQKLVYNNRKIIPFKIKDGIIVNIPDRTLYYFQNGKLARSLPVALGTATKNEKYVWQTPVGKFKVTAKQKDPTWYVPPSIQSEMEEQGKEVITSIPPGPENPLGKYAIKTSLPGILIHSTTKPWSIYSYASHGCIRVYPAHMEDFFKEVRVNTPGEIIYKPVKLAVTENGRIFLEVHKDVYNKGTSLAAEAKSMIERRKVSGQVDWQKFEAVLKQKTGIAEDITL
ncbi:MAG TPA: L,D-transpeptidase family protein [Desulfuromonadales bacterium]|nr:L,D-transpeptidase family protein [Desulfuromonadales bacterium]